MSWSMQQVITVYGNRPTLSACQDLAGLGWPVYQVRQDRPTRRAELLRYNAQSSSCRFIVRTPCSFYVISLQTVTSVKICLS